MDILSNQFVSTIVWALYAIVLMFLSYKIMDMVTPYNFAHEIKEKNPAIGAVIGGIFIAVGIIIKTAIIS